MGVRADGVSMSGLSPHPNLDVTASAEGAQFNLLPFPATASAEGRLIKGGPSPARGEGSWSSIPGQTYCNRKRMSLLSSMTSLQARARWLATGSVLVGMRLCTINAAEGGCDDSSART